MARRTRYIYIYIYIHILDECMTLWGEPERAPHRRVCCKFSIYIYIYIYLCRTSCRKSLPALILRQSTFRSNSLTWYIVMDSRLRRRNERERVRRAAETAGQKERRLKQRRERDRAKRAAQSVEHRQARLHKSATERKRQAAETPDHREARLEEWRAAQQELEIGS